MATAAKYRCKRCQKNVAAVGTVPTQMRYRKHDTEQKTECPNSRTLIPMWIIKRGPETSEDDRPKVGRDYGPCPACGRSPLLDDEGMYVQHIVKPGVPAAEQVVCDMTGKPYVSEGETACSAPSDAAPEVKPSTGAPRKTTAPTRDAPAPGPSDPEEMISKWAKTARGIEDRELPPPSPESTTTPPSSPPQQSDPSRSTPATSPTGAGSPDGAGVGASNPPPQPCHIAIAHPPHEWMRKKQRTPCPGKPAPTTARTESAPDPTSAEDAAAASEAAPSSTSTSGPKPADAPAARPARAPAPTGPPPDIEALAQVFPRAAAAPADEPYAPEGQECKPGTAAGPLPATPPLPPAPAVTQRALTRDAAAAPTASPNPPSQIAESSATAKSSASPALASPSAESSITPESTSSAAALVEPPFARPGSPFVQPGPIEPAPAAVPMSVPGERIAAALRQLFFDYDHRKSDDNRGAQAHLGPSEIGSPCDRRLAMNLLGIPAVSPGGDGWSAFVGSAVHEALARMFQWADAGSGRYAVETPLSLPSEHVPRGTADLLDRTLVMVLDHKAMGRWSLDKLKSQGPSPTYRVQVHTYAYGMRLKGESVDHVALVAWPRESSSLSDLYVWTEPYDPVIAREALARVDRIAETVAASFGSPTTPLDVARQFPVADDCRFCKWFAPGDPDMTRGCPGR